ncbi:hypothetical protein Pla163_03290 [Planctomycetes bacterium Pla163]|uniref:DUF502 domain-containing protein n=1 Tax=Rohdeia mirabilis TaxID=2528008 RepID=A0A518CVI9_9BACT|nr:hypothetical protein Pla163_03290 [Planctomycetes bacterium Pla163]
MGPKWIGKTFLRGLAAVLPVAVTLYLLWWLATTAEKSLGAVARWLLGEGMYVPGTGVVLGFALVLGIGVVMRAVVVRQIYDWIGERIERLPLVKSIYGPMKDLMSFLASTEDERKLNTAVRIDFRRGDGEDGERVSLVGFLTREDAAPVSREEGDERVVVYLPMSYQLGGYMLVVPRAWVTELDMTSEDVLRMTLTAGMSISEHETAV